ncbi:MAG: CAP domain-containing protein [Caldilineaceae bacterium]|nr:CAP domain-containing protein [Caldilineaceae bacterium]
MALIPLWAMLMLPPVGMAQSVDPVQPVPVNPQHREASLLFYRTHYLLSGLATQEWNGDALRCDPGQTDPAFRQAVLRRINYYRGMAGLAGVTLNEEYNRKAQQAALITTVNGLSHRPLPSARCYTADGAQAAANSHLYIGRFGPSAIDGYIQDHDEGFNNNYHVGHRRWILLPQLQAMGTGDIAGSETVFPTNALWVVDASMRAPRPETRDGFVAWPPPGYVPYTVVYPRWSFSYAGADFSHANVHMRRGALDIELQLEALYEWEPTEPTLVWVPLGMHSRDAWPQPEADATYTVTVSNIKVGNRWLTFSYDVTIFDPMAPVVVAEPTPILPLMLRQLHYRQSLLQ